MIDQDRIVLSVLYKAWRRQTAVATDAELSALMKGSAVDAHSSVERLIESGHLFRSARAIYLTAKGLEAGINLER